MIEVAAPITQRSRLNLLEGWVERVDLNNRRLHVRTGSRDRIGSCLVIPEDCTIQHQGFDFHLRSLLPYDAISITYQEEADGLRIAHAIELTIA